MKPRKNTVNNFADLRDPPISPAKPGRQRKRLVRSLWQRLQRSWRRWPMPTWLWSIRPSAQSSNHSSVQASGEISQSDPGSSTPSASPADSQTAASPAQSPAASQPNRPRTFITRAFSLLRRTLGRSLAQFLASLTFYTLLPIPFAKRHEFHRIARFAPWVGLLLGLMLGMADWGLGALGMNAGLRTAIIVVSGLGLTGGLHMDGAMDSADGLAVMEPKRRLSVMSDSVTGAFGVMVAMSLLLLKFAALMALPVDPISRTVALMAAMGWGRWGQVLAIDRYVYLKAEGKGAFHKRQLRSPDDLWLGLIALLGLSALFIWFYPYRWILAVGMVLGGFAIAFGTGAWFDRQLGGHTGDTYGAVVEWTEALLLCLLTLL